MIGSRRRAYLRRHLCEFFLLLALAAPVVATSFSPKTLCIVGFFFVAVLAIGYRSDMSSSLRVDDDGLTYLDGGHDRRFLAWSEIGEIVPRRYRGWPAEDALVVLGRDGRPLLVAGVSMFAREDTREVIEFSRAHVVVAEPVALSPFTARAGGRRRPELAPQRTSERLLASAVGGGIVAAVLAVAIFVFVEA